MAAPCEIALPSLLNVPTEQRFSADDREAIALAEILVKSDIAAAEDWEKSERDPTKYVLLTLNGWLRAHDALVRVKTSVRRLFRMTSLKAKLIIVNNL
jgi:hypothetical protein